MRGVHLGQDLDGWMEMEMARARDALLLKILGSKLNFGGRGGEGGTC